MKGEEQLQEMYRLLAHISVYLSHVLWNEDCRELLDSQPRHSTSIRSVLEDSVSLMCSAKILLEEEHQTTFRRSRMTDVKCFKMGDYNNFQIHLREIEIMRNYKDLLHKIKERISQTGR